MAGLFAAGFFMSDAAAQEVTETVIDTVMVQEENGTKQDEEDIVYFDALEDSFLVTNRQVPDSTWRRLRAQKDYWYANAPLKDSAAVLQQRKTGSGSQQNDETVLEPSEERDSESSGSPGWLFYLLLAGFVGLLLWFLVTNGQFELLQKNQSPYQKNRRPLKKIFIT